MKGLTVAMIAGAVLWPLPVAGQEWVRDARAGTVTRAGTIEGLGSRYRSARAELMLRCRNGRTVDVAMVLYGGPAQSMPAGLARVDNGSARTVNVETRTYPDEAVTIALVSPLVPDGGALRRAMREGLSLRVAVDFPELAEAVLFRASLRGFTAQERRACG